MPVQEGTVGQTFLEPDAIDGGDRYASGGIESDGEWCRGSGLEADKGRDLELGGASLTECKARQHRKDNRDKQGTHTSETDAGSDLPVNTVT